MDKKEEIRRINAEIAFRFGKIEEMLSNAKDIAGIFEILFAGIEKEFGVPFIWLTLIDIVNNAPIIAAIKSSAILKSRLSVVTPEVFHAIIPAGLKPVLVNKDLQPYYKLLPSSNKYFVRSLALVPFKLNNEIVGSWNNGDASNNRYAPGMETSLLQKLAQAVSMRLTELIYADS